MKGIKYIILATVWFDGFFARICKNIDTFDMSAGG